MNLKTIFLSLKMFVGYVLALFVVSTLHPDLMNTVIISSSDPKTFGYLFADFVLPLSLLVLGSILIETLISIFNYIYSIIFPTSLSKETHT